jgi:hypothetical protein
MDATLQLWNNSRGKANVVSRWNWKYPRRGSSKYFVTMSWIYDTIREEHVSFQMTLLQARTSVNDIQTVCIQPFVLIASSVLELYLLCVQPAYYSHFWSDANKVKTSFHIPQSWLFFWMRWPAVSNTFVVFFLGGGDSTWLNYLPVSIGRGCVFVCKSLLIAYLT